MTFWEQQWYARININGEMVILLVSSMTDGIILPSRYITAMSKILLPKRIFLTLSW